MKLFLARLFTRATGPSALSVVVLAGCLGLLAPSTGWSQLAGKGTIQGIVSDASGAVISNATITIRNLETGVVTTQHSTASGFYSLAGFDPGTYDIAVTAAGFQGFTQRGVALDALQTLGVNAKLKPGASEVVTVSDSLPSVDTTNGTLGSTIETETFRALPLNMSGAPRDPTSFLVFTPGVKSDGRYGSFNGGQIDHNETYLDGVAISSPNVQGDNSSISRGFSVDAVDQFQAQTNGISAIYDGQGIQNYTHKSGTNEYHGSAFEYFRNTVLDSWGFFKATSAVTGLPIKPVERQNEFGGTLGGFVVKNKVFFFGSYDGMRFLHGASPGFVTVPTMEMRTGDFSALKNQPIYDPTATKCVAGTCTRTQYQYGGRLNVMDPAKISPQAKYLQSFLPAIPLGAAVTNNFLAGFPTGFTYEKISTKIDFDLIKQHRLSLLYTYGNRRANPLCCDSSGLPQPYTQGVGNTQFYHTGLLEDTWTVNDHTINQLKYAVNFTGGPSTNPGEGDPAWAATAAGLSGLPPGQASDAFPRTAFSGANAPLNWGSAFAGGYNNMSWYIVDNLQLVRGRNSITIGGQYSWLDSNNTTVSTGTAFNQNFAQAETGTFAPKSSTLVSTTGFSYASFLGGAVNGAGITDNRAVLTTGARYFTITPFVQDDVRLTEKLTVNLGLRWDIYSPYSEVKDRLSFFNPNLPNPAIDAPGALQFAGSGTAASCNCRTPVSIWLKNLGPRLSFAYAQSPKTVFRGSYGINYTHAGGVGGRGGAQAGTGQLGLTSGGSYGTVDGGITPAFYLQSGLAPYAAPAIDPAFGTGYTTTPGYTGSPNGVSYADPYLSRRAPYFNNFALGFQRELIKQTTLSVDYSGSTGHFLGTGIGRGIYSDQLDPKYLVLGGLLNQKVGATGVLAQAQAIMPGLTVPSKISPAISLALALRPFPEYSGVSDIWGDVGSSNYNSLQVSIVQEQPRHGLTYSFAYTFSKSLSDVNGAQTAYGNNAARAYGLDPADQTHNIQSFVVYNEPFGRGDGNRFVKQVIRGWSTSATFHYTSGTPMVILTTGCNTPNMGECLPNLVQGTGPVRINGGFHPGNATLAKTVSYISGAAFATPVPYTFGNGPNAAPFGLRNPNSYDIDASLRRAFDVYEPWHLKFTFEASAFNVDNHTQFGGLTLTPTSASFGTVSSQANAARDIQLAARFDF